MRALAAPTALAAALAIAYVVVAPYSVDLAAHEYRAWLFEAEGFSLWNAQWYGGHHVPGYSLLFPPVAAALGPRLAGALAAVAAATLFTALVHGRWGNERAVRVAALWFAAATATNLLTGRLAFGFGLAWGLGSLLALQRGRPVAGAALAVVCGASSPVAAVFLALAAVATRTRAGLLVAGAALAPVALLSLAFPEGGSQPFALSSFLPVLAVAVLAVALLPRRERALRAGAALYAGLVLLAWAVPSPLGGNAARLGPLVAGPLAVVLVRDRRLLALAAVPLVYWQWQGAVRDVRTPLGDPSTRASYYRPLLAELERRGAVTDRIEIPFTRTHWEARHVAPRFALARGWERQLDRSRNELFYGEDLAPAEYERWLGDNAVAWVALPDVALDESAQDEAELLRGGLPYLREVWRSDDWVLWRVRRPAPLASGPARVIAAGPDELVLAFARPGRTELRVRWTPYWRVAGGAGCVARTADDRTAVSVGAPGRVRLVTSFSPLRARATGRRCS